LTETTLKNGKADELTVALLIEDLSVAQRVSRVFREMGVIPQFYSELQSYWNDIQQVQPTLSIIDVAKMSEGDLQLKRHPLVKESRLNLAFIYSEETEPLLLSTYEISHYGKIKEGSFYKGEIKSILRSLNNSIELSQMKRTVTSLESRVERLIQRQESLKEKNFYRSLYNGVIERFEAQTGREDFFSCCGTVLSSLEEVDSFTFFELSPNQKRLISPDESDWEKYQSVPSIWLGKGCPNGIEYFAQNMAMQTSFDVFGEEFMSLQIKGKLAEPEKLIFIKVKDEAMLANFDWNQLESYLSGLNARFMSKLKNNNKHEERNHSLVDTYHFLSLMEENNPINKGSLLDQRVDYTLFMVDLRELISTAMNRGGYRFHWHSFLDDFLNRFKSLYQQDFYCTTFGIEHLCFLVKTGEKNTFGVNLRDFSLRYAYWKFFEDADIVLGRSMKPSVEELATDVRELLGRVLYGEGTSIVDTADRPEVTLDDRIEEIVWGKGADQVM